MSLLEVWNIFTTKMDGFLLIERAWCCPKEAVRHIYIYCIYKKEKQQCRASVSNPLLRDTPTSDSKGNYESRAEKKGDGKSFPSSCSFFPLFPPSPLLYAVLSGSGETRPLTQSINTCKDILSLWSERCTKQLKHGHWQINWLWKWFFTHRACDVNIWCPGIEFTWEKGLKCK